MPGHSPAGSTSGRGGNPCPAGTGGGTRLPGHHHPGGDRAQAALAHAERGRGEGIISCGQGTLLGWGSCPAHRGEPLTCLLPHGDSSWVPALSSPPRRVTVRGSPWGGRVQPRGCQPWPGVLSLGQGREGTQGILAPQGAGGFTFGGRFADVATAGGAALGSPRAVAVGVTQLQAGSQGAPQRHRACTGLPCGTAAP